jgi:3-deoxy-D-manno-octulosonate 8-phosphate phosphatase (KDO 8-P phosphatase)
MKLEERAKKIKLLLMDCDGVLTDGRLYYGENGESLKVFHVRDGQGIVMWHQAGFQTGIITGRDSAIVKTRANELGIKYIKVGSQNKEKDFADIFAKSGLNLYEIAYIGDDLPDIGLMEKVGFAITVKDAATEVKPFANYITKSMGGFGAVREVIDLLLSSKKIN